MKGDPWHDLCLDRFGPADNFGVRCEVKRDASLIGKYDSPHGSERITFDPSTLRLSEKGADAMLGRYGSWNRKYACTQIPPSEGAKLLTEWLPA